MQSELAVEDVIRERSTKVCCSLDSNLLLAVEILRRNGVSNLFISPQVFKERCWKAYKPPDA